MFWQGTGTPVNRSPVYAHVWNRLHISHHRAGKRLVSVFLQVLQSIIYFSSNLQDGLGVVQNAGPDLHVMP